ncbi:MAG TPA: hypothetical protein DCM51_01020, partial [Actinobacteria bacterium]|nr:hypothetical protein [Actinomycetota bacterium]
ASGGVLIAGFQAVLFALLAREFAATERLLPPSRTVERLRHRISFEVGLVVGLLAVIGGVIALIVSLGLSTGSSPTATDATVAFRLGTCAVVVVVVGVQIALGSAFLSVLELRRLDSAVAGE